VISSRDWLRSLLLPLTILAWLAVAVVAGWLLGHIAHTLLLLGFSLIIALALTPIVNVLARWLPRLLAIAISYLLGFALLFGLGLLIVTTAANETTTLVHHLPHYQRQVQSLEPQLVRLLHPFGVTRADIRHAEHQALVTLQQLGTSTAHDSLHLAQQVLNTLVDLVLVLILSVYLTAGGPRLAASLRRETPRPYRRRIALLLTISNRVIGGYIRGTLAMAALVGVLVGGGMLALGVPYAIVLGVLAFFMEFVPILGVLISGAVCVLIALTQGWLLAVVVLAYFVVVHVIEGDIVGPRIMGRAVGIHPMTAIIALLAGTELFGIWGALFGAPLAGLLQALAAAFWQELRAADSGVGQQDGKEEPGDAALEPQAECAGPPAGRSTGNHHTLRRPRVARSAGHPDDERPRRNDEHTAESGRAGGAGDRRGADGPDRARLLARGDTKGSRTQTSPEPGGSSALLTRLWPF
jgi:predicted PurR-regulated permease PerM